MDLGGLELDGCANESFEEENDLDNFQLSISSELASKNYDESGELIEEENDEISISKNSHLLNDRIHLLIEEVLEDVKLPYRPSDFQMLSLHVLGSQKNLVLISPTGSGKTLVIFLSTLLLRKVMDISKGVSLVTEPLNLIMSEKLRGNILPTGVISMTGQLKTSLEDDDDIITLSRPEEEFLNGVLPCLFGHPESWLSETGKNIIKQLYDKQRILLNVTDEMHASLDWDGIRPQMKSVCGLMRIFAVKGAPTLSMTATATEEEVLEIKECLGLKDVVVLRASPVQEHFKFLALRRPSNNCGFDGDTDKNGRFHPGLSSILNRLYLNKFIECLMAGIEPKKCIIFFRTEMQLLAAYEDLQEKLPQL